MRFSIRDKPEVGARTGIVKEVYDDDGIEVAYIRGEEWEYGNSINVAAFDPNDHDQVHAAEVLVE